MKTFIIWNKTRFHNFTGNSLPALLHHTFFRTCAYLNHIPHPNPPHPIPYKMVCFATPSCFRRIPFQLLHPEHANAAKRRFALSGICLSYDLLKNYNLKNYAFFLPFTRIVPTANNTTAAPPNIIHEDVAPVFGEVPTAAVSALFTFDLSTFPITATGERS